MTETQVSRCTILPRNTNSHAGNTFIGDAAGSEFRGGSQKHGNVGRASQFIDGSFVVLEGFQHLKGIFDFNEASGEFGAEESQLDEDVRVGVALTDVGNEVLDVQPRIFSHLLIVIMYIIRLIGTFAGSLRWTH